MNRATPPLKVTGAQRSTLLALTRSTSAPHRQVVRARALLLAADGVANDRIAVELGLSATTVRSWRVRFQTDGLAQLGRVRPGQGPKPTIPAETVAAIVHATSHSKPKGHPQWSCQTMAEEFGVSAATVHRIWHARGLKPHLAAPLELSTDPPFEERLTDVVGVYLNPPLTAVALCMDEKSQVQALTRNQPSHPMRVARARATTHGGRRNSITTLLAALDVVTGSVIGHDLPRHRHEEFLTFLTTVDREVPSGLAVHLVLDNDTTHQHADVQRWLDRHRRFQLHVTPTDSSWLYLVEQWLREPSDRTPRRGSFNSVPVLIAAIEEFASGADLSPFVWAATTDSILEKVRHGRVALQQAVGQ